MNLDLVKKLKMIKTKVYKIILSNQEYQVIFLLVRKMKKIIKKPITMMMMT